MQSLYGPQNQKNSSAAIVCYSHVTICSWFVILIVELFSFLMYFAKLSQAPTPAPAGWLSLALFSFNPPTRPAVQNSSEIDGNLHNML